MSTRTNDSNGCALTSRGQYMKDLHDVIAGDKPFMVVDKKKAPDMFRVIMNRVELLDIRVHFNNELALSKKGGQSFVPHNRYIALHLARQQRTMSRAYFQRQMGKLFGYNEQDIEDFINSGDYCECRNCGGKYLT